MIAKAMFDDGFLSRQLGRFRSLVVVVRQFGLKRGEKGIRKFGEIVVGPLPRAAPKHEISRQRQHDQEQREKPGIPKREPYANRVKHGPSSRKSGSCHAGGGRFPPRAVPAFPPRRPDQRNTRHHAGCAATPSSAPCRSFFSPDLHTPRSSSKTDQSFHPTRVRQFPRGPPRGLRSAPE